MQIINYVIFICWSVIGLVWLVGAIYNFFKAPKAMKKSSNFTIILIISFLVVMFVQSKFPHKFWLLFTYHATWLTDIGMIFLIGFTLFTVWARWKLGKMWSSTVTVKSNHELRTKGPYKIVRHPIYTGILGMILGTLILEGFNYWLLLFIIAVFIFKMKIRDEERFMIEIFGDKYINFQKRTPQLVPGLKWKK